MRVGPARRREVLCSAARFWRGRGLPQPGSGALPESRHSSLFQPGFQFGDAPLRRGPLLLRQGYQRPQLGILRPQALDLLLRTHDIIMPYPVKGNGELSLGKNRPHRSARPTGRKRQKHRAPRLKAPLAPRTVAMVASGCRLACRDMAIQWPVKRAG